MHSALVKNSKARFGTPILYSCVATKITIYRVVTSGSGGGGASCNIVDGSGTKNRLFRKVLGIVATSFSHRSEMSLIGLKLIFEYVLYDFLFVLHYLFQKWYSVNRNFSRDPKIKNRSPESRF